MSGFARFMYVLLGVTICNAVIALLTSHTGWFVFDSALIVTGVFSARWAES